MDILIIVSYSYLLGSIPFGLIYSKIAVKNSPEVTAENGHTLARISPSPVKLCGGKWEFRNWCQSFTFSKQFNLGN